MAEQRKTRSNNSSEEPKEVGTQFSPIALPKTKMTLAERRWQFIQRYERDIWTGIFVGVLVLVLCFTRECWWLKVKTLFTAPHVELPED